MTEVPPTGETRAAELRKYAEAEGLDMQESVAYADSTSDLPMLEAVGFPGRRQPRDQVGHPRSSPRVAHRELRQSSPAAPRKLLPLGCQEVVLMAKESHRHPRPGLVLDVDRSTPPILFHHGEGFRLEKLPPGRSRVIYPAEPLDGLANPDGAIRDALENPTGDSEPLSALLTPGMKLTIAFDDISLPLPPMRKPDIRQRVIEAVLDSAAANGVDDVHLIAALALHRRMTEDELRHAVGDRVYDAFAPSGNLYNLDAEDPDNMVVLGTTPHGEEVQINKRAAESDLIVYVNINLVSMDGGWKSTATGLSGYTALRHHHNPETMVKSKSFMDKDASELHHSNWRQGKVLRDSGIKVFQIETTVNNNTFGYDGPLSVLQKREWEWTAKDRVTFMGMQAGLKRMSPRARRKAFQGWLAPYELTSVQAGEVEAVHDKTLEHCVRAAPRAGRGPDRHHDDGSALHLAVQRQLDHEPDPGGVPGTRVLLQHVPRQATGP